MNGGSNAPTSGDYAQANVAEALHRIREIERVLGELKAAVDRLQRDVDRLRSTLARR